MMDEDERHELMAEDRADKRYRARYSRHPDCRDPDHPGCDACNDDCCEECGFTEDECECGD